jgi:hypothetical protein
MLDGGIPHCLHQRKKIVTSVQPDEADELVDQQWRQNLRRGHAEPVDPVLLHFVGLCDKLSGVTIAGALPTVMMYTGLNDTSPVLAFH